MEILGVTSRHHDATGFVSGLIMIAVGIVLLTGLLQQLNQYFNLSGSGLGARI